ncbi:MAG: PHP domain-containing protein [Chitinophagaceae bacterium]|nr:PHP domain-containing protein [Chitinophagaceae bacterium]
MKTCRAIIHLHTRFSYDCQTRPEKIVDLAIKKNIDLICITDHDSIEGSVAAKEYAKQKYGDSIIVLIGGEFYSDFGDIIGIGIQETIEGKDPENIINRIKEQDGLVLLPHPYYAHKNIEWLAEKSDLIEVFNGRVTETLNQQAADLAQKFHKPTYAASDAHLLQDSFLCRNEFTVNNDTGTDWKSILLSGDRKFETGYSPKTHLHYSQLVKGWKKRNTRLMFDSGKKMMKTYVKNILKKGK